MPAPILIVTLHPDPGSLCHALAQAYAGAAQIAGHRTQHLDVARMQFSPDMLGGYRAAPPLEPDLQAAQHAMQEARHWVLVTPMWWGGLPARGKGFLDRVLMPGFAFDPRNRHWGKPRPLLTKRTARLVMTSDSPDWYFRLVHRAALRRQIEGQVLRFCGVTPTGFTHFSPVDTSTDAQRASWLAAMKDLGARGA